MRTAVDRVHGLARARIAGIPAPEPLLRAVDGHDPGRNQVRVRNQVVGQLREHLVNLAAGLLGDERGRRPVVAVLRLAPADADRRAELPVLRRCRSRLGCRP